MLRRVNDLCSLDPLLAAQLENTAHRITCRMYETRSPSKTEGRERRMADVFMYIC